jgi:hypothetical protein
MVQSYRRNLENASNAFFEEDHPDLLAKESDEKEKKKPSPIKTASVDEFVNKYTCILLNSSGEAR